MIALRPPPPLPDFLAVTTQVEDPARLTALTPNVMRWDETTWIMDLSASRSYWQAMALRLRQQPLALVREVLERTVTAPGQPLRAALADHPWPAALVLGAMTERRLDGFLQLETPFAQTLYRDVVWSGWMAAAEVAAGHLAARKTVPFNGANYRRQSRQLLSAARRLRLASPWELRSAAALSVRRRFGPTIAALWEWTFPESASPSARAAAVAAFPWRRFEWTPKPMVPRVLEFALWQWEALAPLLCEDLDKLCRVRLASRGYEGRVTELSWKLTLNDLREMPVEVSFRHPHDLGREVGHHKTALLQAQYAFEAALRRQKREDDNDIEVPVIAWSLTLDACLSTPPVVADLFGGLSDESCEEARILELENQLPVALAQYGLCQDWLPEHSFTETDEDEEEERAPRPKPNWAAATPAFPASQPGAAEWAALQGGSGDPPYSQDSDDAHDSRARVDGATPAAPSSARPGEPASFWDAAEEFLSGGSGARLDPILSLVPGGAVRESGHDYPWLAAARQRPLFIYADPEPLDTSGQSSGRVFIERTCTKWWRAASDKAEHRDYYRLLDRMNRSSWVFQDGQGQWFVHGVFA